MLLWLYKYLFYYLLLLLLPWLRAFNKNLNLKYLDLKKNCKSRHYSFLIIFLAVIKSVQSKDELLNRSSVSSLNMTQ